ncbi:MAG: hypothetical protein HN834_24905 [Rhodospirillaceae bacterium]|jgi:hypothetical protein|nr:hypothetical protein [Rhodospirillaceae bacterium]MBT5878732.1 hypothetical protein [Rhodospirillaceae bacterium]MBT7288701.1 hypothetical protein [Rhodospirillaceae bacterium]
MLRSVQKVALQAGDRLEKVGQPGRIWVVEHLVKSMNQMPHAVIVDDKNNGETRMLAQSVLCDISRYRRL